jgi:hypothetical protein
MDREASEVCRACVGPERAAVFGLRAEVERTGAENASTRIHLGVSVLRAGHFGSRVHVDGTATRSAALAQRPKATRPRASCRA